MQFNFLVANNTRSIRLWQQFRFETVGIVLGTFSPPRDGLSDALVMQRPL